MTSIELAQPIDQSLIKHLVEMGEVIDYKLIPGNNEPNFCIPPKEAKKLLLNNHIYDPHDFVCATENCNAPITCCSYDKNKKKRTYYMSSSKKIDLHKEHCKHSVKYVHKAKEVESHLSYILEKSEEIKIKVNSKNGFGRTASQSSKNKVVKYTEDSEQTTQPTKKSYKTNKNNSNRIVKTANEYMDSVKNCVALYKENEETIIKSPDTGKYIAIKYLFTSMKNNKLYRDLASKDLFRIFKDKVILRSTKNGDLVGYLDSEIKINDEKYKPSIFFSEKFMENNYPDKYEEYQNNGYVKCFIYTTYRLYLDEKNNYLNFADFNHGNKLTSSTTNLEHNVYLD